MPFASISFCVLVMRATFSITNHSGRTPATMRAKSIVKSPRPLFSSRLPAEEKSWHGGPPIIICGSNRPTSTIARAVSLRSSCMARWVKLLRYTASAADQLSNAASTVNPARAKPRLSPPHPQNKSTQRMVKIDPGYSPVPHRTAVQGLTNFVLLLLLCFCPNKPCSVLTTRIPIQIQPLFPRKDTTIPRA